MRAWASRSQDQRRFRVVTFFRAYVFHSFFPVVAQKVKAQAVHFRIDLGDQLGFQGDPLGPIEFAFEHGELDAGAVILAQPGDAAQAFRPASARR